MSMWSVCIDAGKFDVPLYDSDSKKAAKTYRKLLKLFSKMPIAVKRTKKLRELREDFVCVDFPVSVFLKPVN